MSDYLKKAVFGFGYAFVFATLGMVANYGFRLIMARNLRPEEFGLFYAVLAFIAFLHLFREIGFKASIIKFLPEYIVKKEYGKANLLVSHALTIWLSIAAIILAIVLVFGNALSQGYFHSPSAWILLVLLAVAYTLNCGDYLLSYIFQGFQRIGIFSSIDFFRSTLIFVLSLVGFVIIKDNLIVPASAYVITSFVLMAVYAPILKFAVFREFRLKWGIKKEVVKEAVHFGLPVTFTSFAYTLFQQMGVLTLTYFGSLTDVAMLSVAIPTSSLLVNVSSSISNVIFPLSSELKERGMNKQMAQGLSLLYRYTLLIVLPAALILISYSGLILRTLFGESYADAAIPLIILSVGAIFWIAANINFFILAGIGHSRDPFKIMIGITLVTFVIGVILIPLFSVSGAALSMALGYAMAFQLSMVSIGKRVNAKIPYLSWAKTAVAGLAFLAIIWTVNGKISANVYADALLSCVLAGAAYVCIAFILRVTTVGEIKGFFSTLVREK